LDLKVIFMNVCERVDWCD